MPQIEIGDEQADYLEALREALGDEHLERYGVMRTRDALQYLIDAHEEHRTEDSLVPPADGTAEGTDTNDADEENDAAESGRESDDDGDGDADATGGGSPLEQMMSLLEENDDVWEEVESNDGKYAVTLPDGTTEYARTQDDVRALLFKHYR